MSYHQAYPYALRDAAVSDSNWGCSGGEYMTDSRWLCLDCGKDTFRTDEYYMLRNKLWRQSTCGAEAPYIGRAPRQRATNLAH